MNNNYKMSPLARVLMGILSKGSWVAGGLLTLFAVILIFQRITPEGSIKFEDGDLAFLGVLAVLMVLALYLIRSIKKEMDNPGG